MAENEKKITRREFIDKTAKGAVAATTGTALLDSLINPHEAQATASGNTNKSGVSDQVISLPKGGGAISGMGEKFQPDLHTGTGNFSVPIQVPPGRNGFQPELTLGYSTGAGNGPFGLGWNLGIPNVSRKTSAGVPQYQDEDTFILSGAEDLVMVHSDDLDDNHSYKQYQPRTEGLWARILQITRKSDGAVWWEVTSKSNVKSIYGGSDMGQVYVENAGHRKTFQWLLTKTEDACGNVIEYLYDRDNKPDAYDNPQVKRTEKTHTYNQVYLTEIRYMNFRDADDSADQYFIKIQLDYGQYEEDGSLKPGKGTEKWGFRPDRFSTYKAGFEIRTARRCSRILMKVRDEKTKDVFHLIKSYRLTYNKDIEFNPKEDYSNLSMLTSVLLCGHREGESQCFPPLEFGYTEFWPEFRKYENLCAPSGSLPDKALNDPNYELIDLTGNGLPDVIHTGRYGTRFWKNIGDGEFIGPQSMRFAPANVRLEQTGVQFADMNGNGKADLLVTGGVRSGYYETTYGEEREWERFRPYPRAPEFSFEDPNVRLVDLTGDGLTDVLKTDERSFVLYKNKGGREFDAPKPVRRIQDAEVFPDVYFSDPHVHLADMSGDGLQDIVTIHNRRIEYWPNLGHGKWGQRILMTDAPDLSDHNMPSGQYDTRRLFLSDVDGDGSADLVYVAFDHIKVWKNLSGNGWSRKTKVIHGTPPALPGTVRLADMKGNGTSGVLWTFAPGSMQGSHYKYLDFTGGVKPNLLTVISNNLGSTTAVEYSPSTVYWKADYKARQPWLTHLPFPVQVVSKVEAIDHISQTRLITTYAYHHGYYDGREREFRGFGRTDQVDTEFFADFKHEFVHDQKQVHKILGASVQESKKSKIKQAEEIPPILTKTWFHPGIYVDEKKYLQKIRKEYYSGDADAWIVENRIDKGDSSFEAWRALRGSVLRTETYAIDGTEKESHPYVVTENGYQVICHRKKGGGPYGIYFVSPLESLTAHYERNPEDPRIAHTLTHEVDVYGNVLKSLSIAYPRRGNPEFDEQKRSHIILTENSIINQSTLFGNWFIGVQYESKQFELRDQNRAEETRIKLDQVAGLILSTGHQLISHMRNYFDGDGFVGLDLGRIGKRCLLTRSESLVFKPGFRSGTFGDKVSREDLIRAGYREYSDYSDHWWVQTQRTDYDDFRYCLPMAQMDPLGHTSNIVYDTFDFLPVKTSDPLDNTVTSENDYLALSPFLITEFNGNRSEVKFDALGFVVQTAVMGKEGEAVGDMIQHDADGDESASTYIQYDLDAFVKDGQPVWAHVKAREEHHAQNQDPRWMETRVFSDGFGRELQTKTRAEDDRWVVSGWKVFNNKGWVVRQYEPFFADRLNYEPEVLQGVSAEMTYDTLGRVIRTDNPDGTLTRTTFDPWQQTVFDANDTVLESDWNTRMSASENSRQRQAAEKTRKHADTPTVVYLDTLGRTFLKVEDNRAILAETHSPYDDRMFGLYKTWTKYDIQGNVLSMIDPRGNIAFRHKYDLAGNILHRWQMDSGERWMLLDSVGNQVKKWDSRNHLIQSTYDVLNRPVELWVIRVEEGRRWLSEKIEYGESEADAKADNLRGQVIRQYDASGLTSFTAYDFKGNLLSRQQKIVADYKEQPDWSLMPQPVFLAGVPNEFAYGYDALNRVVRSVTPDRSVTTPVYNDRGLLYSVSLEHGRNGKNEKIVESITYNAKSQRLHFKTGNGVHTEYAYDSNNFRLISLKSFKSHFLNGDTFFQDYIYHYDCVGNITGIENLQAKTIYHDSEVVDGNKDYVYDALYRLTEATGRELKGNTVPEGNSDPVLITEQNKKSDLNALRRYTRKYAYDFAGNMLQVRHVAHGGSWQRHFECGVENNQLLHSYLGPDRDYEFDYHLDTHGNHVNFSHLNTLNWDFKDQMVSVDKNNHERFYYVYGADGMRVRKVITADGVIQKETVYLGDFEVSRVFRNGRVEKEVETLHVMDDQKRVALFETRTVDEGESDHSKPKVRFLLNDHLGSAVSELDGKGGFISYEEYFPYGGTAYHEQSASSEFGMKRYRYSGKEKDEETGFYYFQYRYYNISIISWISCDKINEMYFSVDSCGNLYSYTVNNPVNNIDLFGLKECDSDTDISGLPEINNIEEAADAAVTVVDTLNTIDSSLTAIANNEEIASTASKIKASRRSYRKSKNKLKKRLRKLSRGKAVKKGGSTRKQVKLSRNQLSNNEKKMKNLKSKSGFNQNVGVLGTALVGYTMYTEYRDSPVATYSGKALDAALSTNVSLIYVTSANPYIVIADAVISLSKLIVPEKYHKHMELIQPSEYLNNASSAIIGTLEGVSQIVKGEIPTSWGNFHQESKSGGLGTIYKLASEAGEWWADKILN